MIPYVSISDSELEPESPILSSIGERFRDNPISIAQAASGAPKVAIHGNVELLSKGGSPWTVPADVYRIKVTYSGGGGGGSAFFGIGAPGNEDGQKGGDTSFHTFTDALGGLGAKDRNPGYSYLNDYDGFMAGAQGGLGQEQGNPGAAGQARIEFLDVSPGDEISYSIGDGGIGSRNFGPNNDGADGFIMVEY